MEDGGLMPFGILPNIRDEALLRRIARLQSHEDFRLFKKWLLEDAREHLVMRIITKPNNNQLEIGVVQGFEDLKELWDKAEEWALKMQNTRLKKTSNP